MSSILPKNEQKQFDHGSKVEFFWRMEDIKIYIPL